MLTENRRAINCITSWTRNGNFWYGIIETLGYGLDDRGSRVRFPAGLGIFLLTNESRTALGPTSLLSNMYQGLFPWRVKRPGSEAGHLPPSSAEVKE